MKEKHIISITFLDGSGIMVNRFNGEEEANLYMNRNLSKLLADGYEPKRMDKDGVIYGKGFWFWKKEVLVKYQSYYTA